MLILRNKHERVEAFSTVILTKRVVGTILLHRENDSKGYLRQNTDPASAFEDILEQSGGGEKQHAWLEVFRWGLI